MTKRELCCPECGAHKDSMIPFQHIFHSNKKIIANINGCYCKKCGYTWQSRIEYPKECPQCKARQPPYIETYKNLKKKDMF